MSLNIFTPNIFFFLSVLPVFAHEKVILSIFKTGLTFSCVKRFLVVGVVDVILLLSNYSAVVST